MGPYGYIFPKQKSQTQYQYRRNHQRPSRSGYDFQFVCGFGVKPKKSCFHSVSQNDIEEYEISINYGDITVVCSREDRRVEWHQQKAEHPWQDGGQTVNESVFKKSAKSAQETDVFRI